MSIYRGSGGAGDVNNSVTINEIEVLRTEAAQAAIDAAASKDFVIEAAETTALEAAAALLSELNALQSANSANASALSATASQAASSLSEINASDSASTASAAAFTAVEQADVASLEAASATASAILTEANVLLTNQDVVLTHADVVLTHADAVLTNADVVSSGTNAGIATTQAGLATSAKVAAQLALDSFDDRYLGSKASVPTLDNDGNALLTGALYWNSLAETLYAWSGSVWVKASASAINTISQELVYTATETQTLFSGADDNGTVLLIDTDASIMVYLNGVKLIPTTDYTIDSVTNKVTLTVGATAGDLLAISSFNYLATYTPPAVQYNTPARNSALNQEAVTQGTSTRTGMSSTKYTGNGTTQSITTGVDMATGDFGGLVWVKSRSDAYGHGINDTVRGIRRRLASDTTSIESTDSTQLQSFDASGFTFGASIVGNQNTRDYVAWSFQTNKKTTGLTNRNKAYTAHYNTDLGFSIVGYVGDGVAGHEIPHHLGVDESTNTLHIFKNRDVSANWMTKSSLLASDDYLLLESTGALATGADTSFLITSETLSIDTNATFNALSNNIISYHFASKAGVSKVGKYIGTGAAGNYVDCGFKVGWVMIKNLTGAFSWNIIDGSRTGDAKLNASDSFAEGSGTLVEFVDGGFVHKGTASARNALNDEYLFLAFAETALDGTKQTTDYSYPTTADTLSIAQNTLISFANGFSASGQVDTQENVGAGVTYTLGVGFEDKHLWLYKDKAGSYGVTENRPLEGLTRNVADTYGVESPLDASLRTTAKHFDYESSTGVALASGENGSGAGYFAWKAFTKNGGVISADLNSWMVDSATTSFLQYKQNEKRVLKSWRIASESDTTRDPRRFTIEGSNDGLNWTAIDSTYTASNYSGNGSELWGDIQNTSANTTAYQYHRINITANNGHVSLTLIRELEFNTILPSDYYLVNEGIQYNSAGTPIERTYLAELRTNASGDVATYRNLPVAKQRFNEVEVHGDLIVRGDIENRSVATSWVNFDGTQNPPLIRDSFNVKDIIDLGVGTYHVVFDTPMDSPAYSICLGAIAAGRANSVVFGINSNNVYTNYFKLTNILDSVNTDVSQGHATTFGGKA